MARQVSRISDLPEAGPLEGDELLEIVQGGENVKVRADELGGGVDNPQNIETVTTSKILTSADNNKILLISTDGVTITLPTATPNFSVDIVKMDDDFITVVATNGTEKFREGVSAITVTKDVTIFSSGVAGKEYVAIGSYEV